MRAEKKVCGNCARHGVYEYPDKVYCELRYLRFQDSIRDTLDTCEEWDNDTFEGCFCVKDCKKKREENANTVT